MAVPVSSNPAPLPPERRQTPRIEVMGRLHGRVVSLGVPVKLREIGFGGFSIESPSPFPKGGEHLFAFSLRDGTVVEVPATSVHTMRASTPEGSVHFTGFAFSHPDDFAGVIERLIDQVTSVISFRL